MSTCSYVVVHDPVDPRELFDAARVAVGAPDAAWRRLSFDRGALCVFQADGPFGAAARAAVTFAANGGQWRDGPGPGDPDRYAEVTFLNAGDRPALRCRSSHVRLTEALGSWLTARGLRWSWRYEDDPWIAGQVT